jgi:serine/threonine protein kinase
MHRRAWTPEVPGASVHPMRVCAKCRSRYSRRAQFCGIDGTRLGEADTDPLIGTTLDRYRIASAIGEGGMGCVYRAVHATLEAEFAIKVLLGDLGADETFVARFRREAQAASRIRSAHVVSVIDFATTPEGLSYLVMEYVNGVALDALIRREGALPPLRATRLAAGIASGLAAAHALGFVHRDVKTPNVLVAHEGGRDLAKLLDFGIVRQPASDLAPVKNARQGSDAGASVSLTQPARLTREGRVLGTPAYMPPEQWANSNVGPSADLYALGVVLFEMLSGEKPFKGDDLDLLCNQILYAAPPRLSPCEGLEDLAARLMAKAPKDRPGSAQEVRDELEQIAARLSQHEEHLPADSALTPPAHATPRAALEPRPRGATLDWRKPPSPGRSRAWLALGAAGAALAAGMIVFLAAGTLFRDHAPVPAPPGPDLAAQVDQALERRGLTLDDLSTLDRQRVERGRKALAGHDPVGIADLLAFAGTAPIKLELVRGKLDRLDGPVASRARALGGERGRQLEERYLGFYKELKEAAEPQEREEIVRRAARFERELASPVARAAAPAPGANHQ